MQDEKQITIQDIINKRKLYYLILTFILNKFDVAIKLYV